jgi:hypothetical protein
MEYGKNKKANVKIKEMKQNIKKYIAEHYIYIVQTSHKKI